MLALACCLLALLDLVDELEVSRGLHTCKACFRNLKVESYTCSVSRTRHENRTHSTKREQVYIGSCVPSRAATPRLCQSAFVTPRQATRYAPSNCSLVRYWNMLCDCGTCTCKHTCHVNGEQAWGKTVKQSKEEENEENKTKKSKRDRNM